MVNKLYWVSVRVRKFEYENYFQLQNIGKIKNQINDIVIINLNFLSLTKKENIYIGCQILKWILIFIIIICCIIY